MKNLTPELAMNKPQQFCDGALDRASAYDKGSEPGMKNLTPEPVIKNLTTGVIDNMIDCLQIKS